jgi:ATP-binding cassette subfamily C protein LapB
VALLAGVAVALVIEWFLRRRRSSSLRQAGAVIDWTLSSTLLGKMMGQPLRSLEERSAASWTALFRDVNTVRALMTGSVVQSLFDLPLALFAVVIVGMIAPPVLPVLLLMMLVFACVAWWCADEVKKGKVDELQQARSLDMFTAEMCRARESVKALAQHDAVTAHWRSSYERWLAESYARGGKLEDCKELCHTLLITSTILITATGALAVVNQWMSVGGLIAANMLAMKAISPIANLAGSWRQLAQAMESGRRLKNVFLQPSETVGAGVNLPRPTGVMTLDKVSFRFDADSEPVFNEVSLSLKTATFYTVVGKNGTGKSTLLKLLTGLYRPDEGQVMIDEYDLQQFSRKETASWISTLSQNVYFLDGTIADQLRRGASEVTDEQIVKACKITGAHAFISRLPKGYATVMREGGRVLSAGSRRKIALAQVMLRNPVVLVLDEPTNDLDHASELELIASLRKIAKLRTVIVVTHSADMVAQSDVALAIAGDGGIQRMTPAQALNVYFNRPKVVQQVTTSDEVKVVPIHAGSNVPKASKAEMH